MAGRYDLIKDFESTPGDALIKVNSSWLLAVVRFKQIVTYSRTKLGSRSNDRSEAAKVVDEVMIIDEDCIALNVTSTKHVHTTGLTATLLPGKCNYLTQIMPGDWVFAWMNHSPEKTAEIIERIKQRKACNEFDDGLKFMGRVQDVREHEAVDPSSGTRHTVYTLAAHGFSELDSEIFYDPQLAEREGLIGDWLGRLGEAVNKFLSKDGIDINKAIPELLNILLGRGVTQRMANPSGDTRIQIGTGLTAGTSPEAPFAYVVPDIVGMLLGERTPSKQGGVMSYADVLRGEYGVQLYAYETGDYKVFVPAGFGDMLGLFMPQIPQFVGKSVWSVLGQYLNPIVNEMYTCMRVHKDGRVYPTLVVRQLPFTTDAFQNDAHDPVPITPYLSLPRWVLDPALVWEADFGRSNSMRFNFVHVSGLSTVGQKVDNLTHQTVRNPPIRDDQDIARSGLRPDIITVACSIRDAVNGPKRWARLRADMVMGQHLVLTGTINCVGLDKPICEGDNIEYRGVIYHVETVTHQCTITAEGHKSFRTTLEVSHGMRSDTSEDLRARIDKDRLADSYRNEDQFHRQRDVLGQPQQPTAFDKELVEAEDRIYAGINPDDLPVEGVTRIDKD
jgi:hypothetical protein